MRRNLGSFIQRPGQELLYILIVWVGIFLLCPNSSAAEKPRSGGMLRYHILPPRSLDPHMEASSSTPQIVNNVYSQLIKQDLDMNSYILDLAESWKRTDDLTYIFKIHKGVRFQNIPPVNGRELTSEDVKYSIERLGGMHGNKIEFRHRYYFEGKLASIETPDKYTIIFKTKAPYAPFLNYLASPWACIVPKEAVENLKGKAIGSGPFILKEFVRGSHALLEKNPNYFKKGLPYLDQIHIKIMSDETALLSAFLAGELDMAELPESKIPTAKKEIPNAGIVMGDTFFMRGLRFRPWTEGPSPVKPPFNDIRVRKAICLAIDKKKVLQMAHEGYGKIQVGPVPNWPPYSLPESDQIEYNPKKAKNLLTEAGYPNGFSAEMPTWNYPSMNKAAQTIQEMLKEVGVNIELKPMELAQLTNLTRNMNYDIGFLPWASGVDPEDFLTGYFGNLESAVHFKWNNKEIIQMTEEQSKILDKEKRVAAIHKIQRKVLEDAPMVLIYTQPLFMVYKPYVHPKTLHRNGNARFSFAEKIWMDKR